MSDTANHPSRGISKTSVYVAAGRAVGAREPDPAVRNPDYLAERLLGDPSTLDVDHPAVRALRLPYDEAMKDVEVVSTVRMMMIRTRFIDDALERAIAAGATQLVIVGAGFDSHAYRYRELLAHARVFEVDRPAMQALKRARVSEVFGGPPPNLTYVALDVQHEALADALARHGYDPARQTFFILEGVTMYLEEGAVHGILRFVGAHPRGSVIVLDFVYRPLIDMLAAIDMGNVPEGARTFVQRFLDLIKDEPWVFGVPADGERGFLREHGLELREALTVGGPESAQRYLTKGDGTQVGAEAIAAAMARMAERARAAGLRPPAGEQPSPERMQEQQRHMGYRLAEAVVAGPV